MSFRGRDTDSGKMDMNEPRRYGGGGGMDSERGGMNDEMDDRRFDSGGRGRRPPFGRGRRPSPPNRDRNNRDFFGRDEPPMMRDRSPMRGSDDRFNDRFKKDDSNFMKRDDRRDTGRPFYGDDSRDRFMDKPRPDGSGGFDHFSGPGGDSFNSRSANFPGGPPPRMPSGGFPKPNECEIIVVNKNHRGYAESVEARVKEIGIIVDMLFLKDEVLLTQTIDDIARRGSLYAMVISPQNETHRSVTVNILHGTPQEHRNMPLEDALKLLGQNFHKHIRLQREKMERERAERGPYVGNVSADREIQFLLRMLADGRSLTETELTAVIRYLTERRDKMASGAEEDRRFGRAPIPPADIKKDLPFPKDDVDVSQKEQDLQNRIMNIMNQGAPTAASMLSDNDMPSNRGNQSFGPNTMNPPPSLGSNIPGLKGMNDKLSNPSSMEQSSALGDTQTSRSGDAAPPSTFINFGDPSVQKALDNLIQTGPNLLKNIKSTLSNQPQGSLLGNTSKPPISSTGMGSPNDAMGMPRDGMGSARGPGGLPDLGGNVNARGPGNMDMGPPRGPGGMSDLGGPRPQRNAGPSDMGMGAPRGGFGGMSDMGGMGSQHDFGGNNMQDSGMNQQRMPDVNRMGPPRSGGNMGMGLGGPRGMGNDFPGQNQFGQFKGPGNQPGNYSGGSFNSGPGMGNMRQDYGGMGRRGGSRY